MLQRMDRGHDISGDRLQVNAERGFLPHKEVLLLHPIFRFFGESKIEIEYDQGEDQAHFTVCKTGRD